MRRKDRQFIKRVEALEAHDNLLKCIRKGCTTNKQPRNVTLTVSEPDLNLVLNILRYVVEEKS